MSACARPLSAASRSLPSFSSKLATPVVSISNRRTYAIQAPGAPRFQVFNRRSKWLQKERAAANPELSRQADYLKDEVAVRVTERLLVR